MKNRFLIGLVTLFVTIFSTFFVFNSVFAAELDHFVVELSPKKAKVGEAMDLTIKAVDKNGAPVTDYQGTVLIFSNTNPEASLPIVLKDSTYTFTESDQGVRKFENGVKFTKPGKQDINVFDFKDEKFTGKDEAEISDAAGAGKQEITFISPEEGLTIGEPKIKVSGSTVKNHKVKLIVNKTEKYDLTSNNNGVFEKDVENLKNGENVFQAQVFDADDKVIGETNELKIKVETNGLFVKSLKLIPEEVFVEAPYSIELIANTGLKEASVVINDTVITLKESGEGVYKGNSTAPKKAGTYKVDVNLVNDMGHKFNELGVTSLKVKELNSSLDKEKKEEPEPKEEPKKEAFTGKMSSASSERDPLKITGLKLVELKTKSILTWDKLQKAKSYNVYKKNAEGGLDFITTVQEPKFEVAIQGEQVKYDDFYVRANGEDEKGKYEGLLSDPTKIKTGPELLIILLVSLFFAGMYLIFKGKKA
ncbi:hypothetical protein BLD25_04210 [Candidatus Gracilibacteria bacterium GN02-872]|nr:hypothetical protein BLD25_04210 [Candidatus Gracilibacteria bacterium GN02-872]